MTQVDLKKAKAGDVVSVVLSGTTAALLKVGLRFSVAESDVLSLTPAPEPVKEYRLEDMWVVWVRSKENWLYKCPYYFENIFKAKNEIRQYVLDMESDIVAIIPATQTAWYEGEGL